MDPEELLDAARSMLTPTGGVAVRGVWPVAAAVLGRQALEDALDELWRRRAPGVEDVSTRVQLLCLLSYLPDPELAQDVAHVWSALSRACHHHAYELPPTAVELASWFGVVARLVEAVKTAAVS